MNSKTSSRIFFMLQFIWRYVPAFRAGKLGEMLHSYSTPQLIVHYYTTFVNYNFKQTTSVCS